MRLIDADKLIEKLEALADSYSDIKYSDNTIEGEYDYTCPYCGNVMRW